MDLGLIVAMHGVKSALRKTNQVRQPTSEQGPYIERLHIRHHCDVHVVRRIRHFGEQVGTSVNNTLLLRFVK